MIEVRDLKKSFGTHSILDGVSFRIEKGESVVIIGRSGGGKSVLLKLLIGLLQPDTGQVLIEGENIVRMNERELLHVRRKFGMLFQSAALFDSMTVAENVGFAFRRERSLPEEEVRRKVAEVLEMVDLPGTEDKKPSELSGGMKKRVGLARAVVLNPKIILFDEPTTGLDPIIKRAIHQLINDTHAKFGFTAVIVTHEIPDIFDVAQNVAMLFQGKILQHGTPDDIKNSDNPAIRQFIRGSLDGPIQMV